MKNFLYNTILSDKNLKLLVRTDIYVLLKTLSFASGNCVSLSFCNFMPKLSRCSFCVFYSLVLR